MAKGTNASGFTHVKTCRTKDGPALSHTSASVAPANISSTRTLVTIDTSSPC